MSLYLSHPFQNVVKTCSYLYNINRYDVQAFVRDVGDGIIPSWAPIAEARRGTPVSEEQRQWQLLRRGRYLEFNLVRVAMVASTSACGFRRCSTLHIRDSVRCSLCLISTPRLYVPLRPDPCACTPRPFAPTQLCCTTRDDNPSFDNDRTTRARSCTTEASSLGWTAAAWSPSWCLRRR